MPDITGLMTPEEYNKCVQWINDHATLPHDECVVCGDPNNTVSQYVWRLMAPPHGALQLAGVTQTDANAILPQERVFPLVITSCMNCGFMRHFNAYVLGVIVPKEAELPLVEAGEATDGEG